MPSPSTSDVVRATDSASVRGASSATTLDAASSACGTALTDGADTNLSDVSGSALEASTLASSTTLSQSRKVACAGLPATPRSTSGWSTAAHATARNTSLGAVAQSVTSSQAPSEAAWVTARSACESAPTTTSLTPFASATRCSASRPSSASGETRRMIGRADSSSSEAAFSRAESSSA